MTRDQLQTRTQCGHPVCQQAVGDNPYRRAGTDALFCSHEHLQDYWNNYAGPEGQYVSEKDAREIVDTLLGGMPDA